MANDDKQSGPSMASSGVILAALLASGTYLFHRDAPLQGSRPAMTEASIYEPGRARRDEVDARLWQDPFFAVAKALNKAAKKDLVDRCASGDGGEVCKTPLDEHDRNTLVIGVTIPGTPYSEDAEHRRRTRYAVLAGLERAGFAPDDAKHLNYFLWSPDMAPERKGNAALSFPFSLEQFPTYPQIDPTRATTGKDAPSSNAETIIVYEAFTHTTRKRDEVSAQDVPQKRVLVLWINEEALKGQPLNKIYNLKAFLGQRIDAGLRCENFKIVGPYSSDILRDMANEARAPVLQTDFYAYGASASDHQLMDGTGGGDALDRQLQKSGIRLHRTTAADDALARGIVGELKTRRVKIREGGDSGTSHIALISEWDSFYGQTLPQSVENAFAVPAHSVQSSWSPCSEGADCDSIHKLTYLRGLDGQAPSAEGNEDRKEDKAAAQGDKQTSAVDFFKTQMGGAKGSDRPVGQGQFDYLRRMSERLRDIDDSLRKRSRKLDAIGILGSDVFDKLLVLRALRPKFPEAVFFTTDFDEAYTMESELAWTRNLIISSSFGPNLGPKYQGEIPPFRDTYQTSAFLATLLATGADITSDQLAAGFASPRIFEIGRTGQALNFASEAQGPQKPQDGLQAVPLIAANTFVTRRSIGTDLQPSPDDLYPSYEENSRLRLAYGLSAAAFLAGVAAFSAKARRRALVEMLLLSCGFAAGALACFYWTELALLLTDQGAGEPLAILQGVSLWPTVLMRAFGIILAAYFIYSAQRSLRRNLTDIGNGMGLDAKDTRSIFAQLRGMFDFSLGGHDDPDSPVDVKRCWEAYVGQEQFWLRAARAAIYTAAMMLIFIYILAPLFGYPDVPGRSKLALSAYKTATLLLVTLMHFVTFFVFDATCFCLLFVSKLGRARTEWPSCTIKRYDQMLRLQCASIHDWIDLEFVAKRTRCIGSLIYFPFILIALLIVSRSNVFANFAPSNTIYIALGISLSVVFGCAIMLCWAARAAKDAARQNLTDGVICAQAAPGRNVSGGDVLDAVGADASQLQTLLLRVDQLKDGAFSPFAQQPLVRAVLLPMGSFGWSAIIENGMVPGL